jgi:hypothetical protein
MTQSNLRVAHIDRIPIIRNAAKALFSISRQSAALRRSVARGNAL